MTSYKDVSPEFYEVLSRLCEAERERGRMHSDKAATAERLDELVRDLSCEKVGANEQLQRAITAEEKVRKLLEQIQGMHNDRQADLDAVHRAIDAINVPAAMQPPENELQMSVVERLGLVGTTLATIRDNRDFWFNVGHQIGRALEGDEFGGCGTAEATIAAAKAVLPKLAKLRKERDEAIARATEQQKHTDAVEANAQGFWKEVLDLRQQLTDLRAAAAKAAGPGGVN